MRPRYEILKKLLKLEENLNGLKKELGQYAWDLADTEQPTIHTRQDILNVLNRYLSGELNDLQLNEWADFIIMREDIDNEKGYNGLINTIMFNIARETSIDPLITREEVLELAEELKTTPFDPNED